MSSQAFIMQYINSVITQSQKVREKKLFMGIFPTSKVLISVEICQFGAILTLNFT